LDTDALLTLNQARAALIGEHAAERPGAWPSIKTLRRAYEAGQLTVIQPVPGGRVMVWRSEIMRWAGAPRSARASMQVRVSQRPTAPAPPKPRKPQPATKAAAKSVSTALPTRRERAGVPQRLSLAELTAA